MCIPNVSLGNFLTQSRPSGKNDSFSKQFCGAWHTKMLIKHKNNTCRFISVKLVDWSVDRLLGKFFQCQLAG